MFKKPLQVFFTHRNIYYLSLILLAMSLPLSIFTTTLAEIFLIINWIWEGNFNQKWNNLKFRKGAILVGLIYVIHLIGMIYTEDLMYGLHDLKIKLPILILPIIIASSPKITEKELNKLLLLFCAAVLTGTLVSGAIFFGLVNYPYLDYRDISIFISHIRMSLMVVLAIFILIYFLFASESPLKRKFKFIIIPVVLWFVFILLILKSITGILILFLLSLILSWKYSGKIKEIAPRFITRVLIITVPLVIASYLSHMTAQYYTMDKIDINSLDKVTSNGNPYLNDTIDKSIENGNYVYLYLCEKELKEEWNKKSKLSYDGKDRKGQELRFTLIRYLTSKGFRKDGKGLNKLSRRDITAIENGIANHIYLNKFSPNSRIYEIIWELDSYKRGNDPSGHSVSQRITYLKAACNISSKHSIIGVGTGDLKNEFNSYYKKTNSLIDKRWWNRAHNQYITFFITFGIVGLILIMTFFILPIFLEKKWDDYLFMCFAIIGFLSMINEDTLETQIGVSFFMFFYSLLLFGRNGDLKTNIGQT